MMAVALAMNGKGGTKVEVANFARDPQVARIEY